MALVVPVIPFAYRRTNYWQLQPHRLVFPMLLAAYMLFCLRKSSRKKNGSVLGRLASVHAGSAVEHREWSVLYHRLVRGCIVRWWQQEPWYARGQWERYGALLLGAVLAVLGAIGLTNLYNLLRRSTDLQGVFFTRCTAAIIWMVPSATRLS